MNGEERCHLLYILQIITGGWREKNTGGNTRGLQLVYTEVSTHPGTTTSNIKVGTVKHVHSA